MIGEHLMTEVSIFKGGRAVDIEIYEDPPIAERSVEWCPVMPRRIRINGVECLTPLNSPVRVEGLLDVDDERRAQMATATVTVFVRSLHAQSLVDGPLPEYVPIDRKVGAADLVVYDAAGGDWIPLRPFFVRFNGVNCLIADDIKIEGLGGKEGCLTATIPFLVRTLKVHGGQE
ncbi:hypothetical protein LITTLEE_2 [Mycobacterium phage LittleE]|uniref:Uncharacterized protein n=1 Tax=Mycobacterium phage LittleE TaxID=2922212 RepID=G1D3N7_9CAUD|nr:hypothetical protein AVV70_gp002 [Mycobacterium phage MiaZeal]YP_009636913.1 enoyl-CoA-hydratase [Mycobacterium phage LittleE]ASD53395.1 hypothetical protein PBI_LUCKY2013_2 [Mycobacterium phage Lucky2013]ASZ74078.1 hypothetical protein SEA_SQUINT_2 [Mycobacterium phage Squint]AEK09387.1 hypothetical protein LITTLEE_2 [Mycobacterium phage LittleE]AIY32356.1 hypothetical protein PBI_MIAZEAL_2 [Mycobacterium phage MiaZeal]